MSYVLHLGDCLTVMSAMQPDSVDAIVTDPPYGLSFMGKNWDHGVPGVPFWQAALRVAKPGAHLLAFGSPRTHHRLMVAIEDAGWEIRDCLMWLYGSGFPKSHDISKAIDKAAPRVGMYAAFAAHYQEQRLAARLTHSQICAAGGFHAEHNHGGASVNWESGANVPTRKQWRILQPLLSLSNEWLPLIERVEAEREVVGQQRQGRLAVAPAQGMDRSAITLDITAPATDAARQWDGWGTALKPAWEPVILARKPLSEATIAANVLRWGTGGLNVDGCRIGTDTITQRQNGGGRKFARKYDQNGENLPVDGITTTTQGRWPANLVLSEDAAALLDEQSGERKSGGRIGTTYNGQGAFSSSPRPSQSGKPCNDFPPSTGGASRFFYTSKASKRDRDEGLEGMPEKPRGQTYGLNGGGALPQQTPHKHEPQRNHHPTVKPVDLCRWLVRLVTPPGGTVLDPFMGSGSTGKAAMLEGFSFVGIDIEEEYLSIADKRIAHAIAQYVQQQEMAALQPRLLEETP